MNFQVSFPTLDLDQLTGDVLLRLLLEHNVTLMRQWCPRCWCILVGEGSPEDMVSCPRCGAPSLRLDDPFWEPGSARVKQALDNNPQLLARVKAEWMARLGKQADAELPYPVPKPLAWLEPLWKMTGRPKGRPFDPDTPYLVAMAVRRYEDMGLTPSEIEAIVGDQPLKSTDPVAEFFSETERAYLLSEYEKVLGPLDPRKRKALLDHLYMQFEKAKDPKGDGLTRRFAFERIVKAARGWQFESPGLTREEICDALQAAEQVKEPEQDGRLTEQQRQVLSEKFRTFVGGHFDRGELWRKLTWVEWQQADPLARLRGERVRERGRRTRPSRQWTLVRVPRKPTSLDEQRFRRVFLWVSQDGLTKEAAIEQEAKVEVFAEWLSPQEPTVVARVDRPVKREELWAAMSAEGQQALKDSITRSLDQMEEYLATIASHMRRPVPQSQHLWQPGWRKARFDNLLQTSGQESDTPRRVENPDNPGEKG